MKAILTFQGFTESIRTRTGTEDLYFNVIRKFANPDVTTYHPYPWTANVKDLAAQVARQNIRHVALVSYSHGQSAALAFVKEAHRYGVDTDLWLACDPVYRPAWLPRQTWAQVGAFRALIPKSAQIRVRTPIKRIAGVRQDQTIPKGHDIAAEHPGTTLQPLKWLPYPHTLIDEAPAWHNLVGDELSAWLGLTDQNR
jgi:hypothetical protein